MIVSNEDLLTRFRASIDSEVLSVINTLESNGFSAFIVGGCVRDILLGQIPKDYDIATNSKPNEILEIFANAGHKCLEIGKKYGTISVSKAPINDFGNAKSNLDFGTKCENQKSSPKSKTKSQNPKSSEFIEITTFRKDSAYIDGRHPKSVEFGENITQDLARRDFGINAIAFSPKKCKIIDEFGGMQDIKSKLIACVGNASERFGEDYLRILRALRFGSTLGFSIEKTTKSAIKSQIKKLDSLPKERINAEFSKLILGDFAHKILREYSEVLAVLFGVDFADKKILEKIALLKKTPKDLALRLSVLCYGLFGAFSNADKLKISSQKAKSVLKNLRYSNEIIGNVGFLLDFADRAWACVSGFDKCDKQAQIAPKIALKMLIKDCDNDAKSALKKAKSLLDFLSIIYDKKPQIKCAKSMLSHISKECFCLSNLAINGNEIKKILQNQSKNTATAQKMQGKQIGEILDFLLAEVIKEQIPNEKSALKNATKKYSLAQ